MKELTVIVPAYNAEPTLRKCLDSLVGLDERLEVIVIDDGSTDGTRALAEEYARRWPETLRVISKSNGGHGSGINTGVQSAQGRYFKVIDADDWIVSENLGPFLDALEKTTADAVITGYKSVNMKSGRMMTYPTECRYAGQEIDLDRLMEVYEDISSCCTFHGLCYRTEPYRASGIRLSEGIYYEDHEYATLPFAWVEKALILPLEFYVYLVGSDNQSVAFPNQVKRIGHIEQVTRRILAYRREQGPLSWARDEYFLKKLAMIAVSYFAVALVKDPDKARGKENARRYTALLKAEEPELLRRTARKRKMLKLFCQLRLPPGMYQAMLDTGLYKRFRKLWIN